MLQKTQAECPQLPKRLSLDILNNNNEVTTIISIGAAQTPLSLTIDTGAQISLLKTKNIMKETLVNKRESVTIMGIASNAPAKTLGKIHTFLLVNDTKLIFGFHITNLPINLTTDGIIGSDLLTAYNAKIDYANNKIEFSPKEASISPEKETHFLKGELDEVEYRKAVQEYREEMNSKQNCTLSFLCSDNVGAKPRKDKKFYEKIDENYFQRYTKIATANILIIQNDFAKILQTKINEYPYFANKSTTPISNGVERTKYLMKNLKLSNNTQDQINQIQSICLNYSDAFYIPGDPFRHTEITEHVIKLKPGTSPIYTRQYKIPHAQLPEVEEQLLELEQKGIIEKSNSAWNSPLLMVKKHSEDPTKQEWRLCIDYKKLNAVTIPEQFPLPEISTIIENLGGSKLFTTLDLQGAFHQVKLAPECKEYTSFSTSWQKYQFTSTPFGLMGSPFTWLRTIHTVLEGLIGHGVYCYMDDLIIHSATADKHVELLIQVLKRLVKNNLKLKISKTLFLQKNVKYLGFIISKYGIEVDDNKTKAIKNFKPPKNIKELQRFLGMCNYFRAHIKGYSFIARNLFDLLKKDTPFIWSEKCENSFEKLKTALTSPPVLIHPKYSEPFIITCDASDKAVAAMLSQGKAPNDKPVQYFSRSLSEVQQRYSTTEKELLSIILALENFRYFIFNKHFTIYTDHKPITTLLGGKQSNHRLFRWKLYLSQYDFEIIYKKGKNNVVADFLSRIDNHEENEPMEEPASYINVVTRAQTESLKQTTANSAANSTEKTQAKENFYTIKENKHLLVKNDDHDLIIYVFDKENCRMHKQLQHKLQSQIKLKSLPGENNLYEIGDKRIIALLQQKPFIPHKAENTLLQIRTMCEQNLYQNIAINLDLHEANTLFEFKTLIRKLFHTSHISVTLYLNKIIEVTDPIVIQNILQQYHDSTLGGHNSFEKTKNAIRKYFSWHNMTSDIKHHIKQCTFCEKNKIGRYTKNPMQISSTASQPFEKLAIDLIGEIFPHSEENHNYILTCIDDLTKWAIAVPIKGCTAITIAHALVTHVILKYGPPKILLSDNASYFSSELISQLTKVLRTKKFFTTPYRPQASICERLHKDLNAYLRTFVQKEQNQWHIYIDYAIYSHNTTPSTMTNFTPYELLFGHEPNLPIEILKRDVPTYNYENYVTQLRAKLREYHLLARDTYIKRKESNKTNYDKGRREQPVVYEVNDLVLLLDPKKKTKFGSLYLGPYRVTEVCGPVTVKIKIGNKISKIHTDRLKKAEANYEPTPLPVTQN